MTVAVYPGSFDPITNGHLDVIGRASNVFDRVVVAVLANPRKQPLLSADERVAVIREALAASSSAAGTAAADGADERIVVDTFDGLTVDFCHRIGAAIIVRGLRTISDFETEMQLAHNNRRLAPDVDTVFFVTAVEHGYVSSSLVKEIASFGGNVSEMIPPAAVKALAGAHAGR
jgi:pantetheine-phosphate adenylyltransferase